MTASPFLDALGADGPAADRAGKMDLYGRFVGSWDLDVSQFSDDGTERRRTGEWHFGWALEGRAIQDVWIVPPRGALRDGDAAARFNTYGTTLRVYDPEIDAWRIQWTDPVTRNYLSMIGRAQGDDIVQLGTRPDGVSTHASIPLTRTKRPAGGSVATSRRAWYRRVRKRRVVPDANPPRPSASSHSGKAGDPGTLVIVWALRPGKRGFPRAGFAGPPLWRARWIGESPRARPPIGRP